MNTLQWAQFFLVAMSVVVIPLLVLCVRGLISITKIEQALKTIVEDVQELKSEADKRLRWLEEHLWRQKQP